MRIARSARMILSALAICTTATSPVLAEDNRAYFSFGGQKRLPDCSASSIQSAVAGSFARARHDYNGGRRVLGINNIREVAYQVNGISPLARRYCRGKASLSDGSYRAVHYLVEEHAGFVGLGWNVEACIASLDKWYVYGTHCMTTRPR